MEAPHCHCIKAHKLIPGVIPGITATFLPLSIVGLFKKKKKNHDIADADNANEEDPYKKLKKVFCCSVSQCTCSFHFCLFLSILFTELSGLFKHSCRNQHSSLIVKNELLSYANNCFASHCQLTGFTQTDDYCFTL